jgi:DNA-binding NarL/FixJ family response regulator
MGAVAASALIGRGDQLSVLQAALEQALAGRGSVALLVGDPGIGKTRLASEVAELAEGRGATVLWGHCYEGEWSPPYGPWIESLGHYLRAADTKQLRVQLGGTASALAEMLPEIGDVPQPASLDPAEARHRLYEAIARLLATAEPAVVVLDDLHLADSASLAVLEHVGRSAPRAKLLVVGAYRDHELELTHPLVQCVAELNRYAASEVVRLPALTREDTAALAETLAGAPLAQAVADAIYAETEGNPFFVGELVHHLVEEGRDLAAGEPTDWGIPESVRQAVGRRLARLSPETNRLLAVSAAFTRPFDVAVLHALTELDEDRLLACLDEGLAAKMISPAPGEGEHYEFVHALVRHTLYEELSRSRQARLHRRIARALELVHGDRDSEYAAELAYQYHRSATLPGALHGVRYALLAADQAKAAHAHAEAAAFLRIALGLAAESESRVRADILCRLAVAEAEALRLEEAARTVEDARAALAESGADASTVAAFLGEVAWALKDGGAGEELLARIVEAGLEAVGGRRDQAWARLMLILHPVERRRSGDLQYGVWLGFDTAAVAVARASGEERDYARTLEPMDWRTRVETDALLERVSSWTDPPSKIHGLTVVARSLAYRHGAIRDATRICHDLAEAAAHYGSLSGQAYALVLLAELEAALGEFPHARARQEAADRLVARLGSGHRLHAMRGYADSFFRAYVDGGWQPVADLFERLAADPSTPWGWYGLNLASEATLAYVRLGARAEAQRLLPVLTPALRERGPRAIGQCTDVADAATAVWELEAVEWAAKYQALANDLIDAGAGDHPGRSAELTVARMATLLGRRAEAAGFFERARRTLEASGQRPLRAVVDYDEALARRRNGEPFAEFLDVARAEFKRLGMTFWIERADELEASARRTSPAGLTRRESEVLRLVATGLTNKEIAAELVLSVHTVERHLANLYSKIGARNRAEATSFALREL